MSDDEPKAPYCLPKKEEYKCGMGMEAQCCRFLTYDHLGYHCVRDNVPELAAALRARTDMGAKRIPEEPYPNCQLKEN